MELSSQEPATRSYEINKKIEHTNQQSQKTR
jgi:hypothetical protein